MGQIRTMTVGRPTWQAAKGTLAYDPQGPHVWINFDGASGWEKLEGLGAIFQELDELREKVKAINRWLIATGFRNLPEETIRDYMED